MNKRIPRYISIKNMIMDAIHDGNILNNGRLPSEDELAHIFNVSRTTVRSALQAMEAEGIVVKKHGSGNFVRLHGKYPTWNSTFAISYFDTDAIPELKKCRIRNITVSDPIARKLNILPGTKALEVFKLMQNKGKESVCMLETFPLRILKQIPSEEEVPDSIYEFIVQFCNLEVKEISSDILAVPASESPFKKLKRPVLKLEEVFYDKHGQSIAYSEYYLNINNVRPHVIRNKPPLAWRVL